MACHEQQHRQRQRAAVQRDHEGAQAQAARPYPVLSEGHEVVIDHEGEKREHQAGAARGARVGAGHGQPQYHEVERGQRQAEAPPEFGAEHRVAGGEQLRRAAGLHRGVVAGAAGGAADARAVLGELADLQPRLVQRGFQALPVAQQGHALAALRFQARAAGRGDGLAAVLAGGDEHVGGLLVVRRLAVDEEHAGTVGRLLEFARGDAVHVAALLVLHLELLDLLVGPGPDQQRQRGDRQDHRPGEAQQRRQQVQHAAPAREPDDHLAFAVHARQGADHGHEQAEGEDGGQLAEHGEAHHEHHVRGVHAAARRLAERADQHHGHDHGDQHHQRRSEAAGQFLANG